MRLLVDTHIAIWSVLDDPKLSKQARELLSDPTSEPFVSVISIWEIAIKHRLARRSAEMPVSATDALDWLERAGFAVLPVSAPHAIRAEQLTLPQSDPFDRMLLAQALAESMPLVTHDARLGAHGHGVIRV
jgi:PIN domain nuclease of toxin-antitoxin system